MNKFTLLITLVFCLFSCSLDIDINYPCLKYILPGTTNELGQNAITFANYTSGQSRALINSESNTGYDDFKFYGWTKDSIVINGYDVSYINNGWVYAGINNLKVHWFDNFVDKYNFIGVIPSTISLLFNGTGINVTGIESFVANPEIEDTPKEFLYTYTQVEKDHYSEGVLMNFKHVNSKIYLKFTSDDPNTQILDYYPGETYHSYEMQGKPFPVQGPSLSANITDEDIEYINSRYTSSLGWIGYYSSNTVLTGDLSESMWDYLITKHPELTNAELNNWSNYLGMKLIHIDKSGSDNTFRGWFINTNNVTLIDNGMVGNSVKGIIMLPAKIGVGVNRVLGEYVSKADGIIDNTECTLIAKEYSKSIVFEKPSLLGFSPSVFYALPYHIDNLGYTIKFSFNYKGVNVYDARVWIPTENVLWEQGKYYIYNININGRGNGHSTPNNEDADDPTIPSIQNNLISVNVTVIDYKLGEEYTYTIN